MKTTNVIVAVVAPGLLACTNVKRQHSDTAQTSEFSIRYVTNNKKTAEAPISVGKVTYITDSEFRHLVMDYVTHPHDWVYNGNRPAVIDFYATWCGPCKVMSPIVEVMAETYAGKIDFYKVDVDQEKQLAATFDIQSIPTFLLVPVSGNPTLLTGAMQKDEFEKSINDVLLK